MEADLIGEMNDGRGETPPHRGPSTQRGRKERKTLQESHNVNAKTSSRDSSVVFYDDKKDKEKLMNEYKKLGFQLR